MTGETISHYRILKKIGEGGMGMVYKAEDTRLKRIVALKFLSRGFAKEEEKVRFLREAQAAATLQHPNICPIYEIDEVDGSIFFAMAFLKGKTVSDLAGEEPLSFDDAASLARQIASGLEEAHEHGIVHRDIKGQNIIVSPKGRASILDFGLARTKGQTALTDPGTALGTAPYMSPEQARGDPVDQRTDLWSFGVVLYEALTGTLPFDSEHHLATLYSIINEDPAPLRDLRPDVPATLIHIVEKALAKDADDRYQAASEILADLTSPSGQHPTVRLATPRSGPPVTEASAPAPRPRRRWAPAVAALVAVCGLAYGGWRMWPSAAAPASAPAVLAPGAQGLYDQGQYYLQRYEQSSNLDQAIALFEDAKKQDPDNALIEAGIAEAYYRKYKITDDRKWIDGALNAADHAVEIGPNIAAPYAVRGLIRNGRGQDTQAIADFEEALAIEPEHVDATRGLAAAYASQGRTTEAEELYQKAIRLAPGDWTNYKSLGVFYFSENRNEEAEEQFRTVVRLTPDNALGHGNLGAVQLLLGKFDEAAESYERSIAIEPRAAAYSNLGNLRFFRERYAEAVDLYHKAIELSPNEEKYWGNLGDGYRMQGEPGNTPKAKDAYQRAIELVERRLGLNPTDAPNRSFLAYLLACLHRPRDAQSELQQALALAETNSDVLFRAALVHELTGRRAAAIEAYRSALRNGYPRVMAEAHPDLRQVANQASE